MRKVITTVGLIAAGLFTAQSVFAQAKPWSISTSVRGFYDDNIATSPANPAPGAPRKQESYGFEIRPEASYAFGTDQLDVALSYLYSLKYYENRSDSTDHMHDFNADAEFRVSPRATIVVDEQFIIAQEPDLLDPATGLTSRSNGDNYRNTIKLTGFYEVSRLLATDVSYRNSLIDYDMGGVGSRSALLDRMEHRIEGNLRWQVAEQTQFLNGYAYSVRDQRGDNLAVGVPSDVRDTRSHFIYIGADHTFNPQFTASVRGGIQYVKYPNALAGAPNDDLAPYADASVSYAFSENTSARLGVRHQRTQTDVFAFAPGTSPTLESATTIVYGSFNHKFTEKISVTADAQLYHSTFQGGANSGLNDIVGIVGTTFNYKINEFLTAETGYNYDRLDSQIGGRAYTRNRVFVGLRATY